MKNLNQLSLFVYKILYRTIKFKVVINELNTLQKVKKNQIFLDNEKESKENNVNIETISLCYYDK